MKSFNNVRSQWVLRLALGLAASVCFSRQSVADYITYDFSGTITDVAETPTYSIQVNNPFTGSLTFNSASQSTGGFGEFGGVSNDLRDIDQTIRLNVGGTEYVAGSILRPGALHTAGSRLLLALSPGGDSLSDISSEKTGMNYLNQSDIAISLKGSSGLLSGDLLSSLSIDFSKASGDSTINLSIDYSTFDDTRPQESLNVTGHFTSFSLRTGPRAVPEPSSAVLAGCGLLILGYAYRRRGHGIAS